MSWKKSSATSGMRTWRASSCPNTCATNASQNFGTGAGGASGECVEFQVNGPLAASYSINVGLGGAAGPGAGAGAQGAIFVEEFYD